MGLEAFWILSDNTITLTGLTNTTDDSYENSATVTCVVTDDAGDAMGSSFTLDYVAASDGNYVGTLLNTISDDMSEGLTYTCTITIVNGANKTTMRIKLRADYRDFGQSD